MSTEKTTPGVHGQRKFYELPNQGEESEKDEESAKISTGLSSSEHSAERLLEYINQNVIGRNKVFSGPFGLRKVVYCDYTASGRSLKFVEDYIAEQVLPDYGNTHTTTSVTSLQTTLFRHEARDIVRNAVHASEHDVVLFTGSGCTGAVHKLIHAMNFQQPPIVFVGPYEHHSNLLPWRELGSEIITIKEDRYGQLDISQLENELKLRAKQGQQMLGCFSAASNVTGVLVPVDEVTECLHRHGALALWDYASAGPYVHIDMNPISKRGEPTLAAKDAIFLSPHKFVGGVQTPGILVAKKKLFKNPVPSGGGGGSVFFVRRESHRYLQEAEMREEGGTPAIVESIRAGLVFQLKEAVGSDIIMEKEHQMCSKALSSWRNCSNLVLLGSTSVPRLPIFSFLVRHGPSGHFLHHNYVCALLNDVFGIQARGGCACAGPYAQELLGISDELAEQYEQLLLEDSRLDRVHLRRYAEYSEREILRPGFVRLNLPYFASDAEVDFVIEAVKLVAEHGWKLLPLYKFNPETGEWRHSSHQVFKDRKWLGHVTYREGHMTVKEPSYPIKGPVPDSYEECLEKGKKILQSFNKSRIQLGDQTTLFDPDAQKLRWFLLPSEALYWQTATPVSSQSQSEEMSRTPFTPKVYPSLERTEGTDSMNDKTESNQCKMHSEDSGKSEGSGSVPIPESFISCMKTTVAEGFVSDCDKPEPGIDRETDIGTVGEHSVTYGHPPGVGDVKENKEVTGKGGKIVYGLLPPSSRAAPHSNSSIHGKSGVASSGVPAKEQPSNSEVSAGNMESSKRTQTCVDGSCFMKRRKTETSNDAERTSGAESAKEASSQKCEGDVTEKHKWHPPPKAIFKPTIQAVQEHNMLKTGDRVLVCLSGGKDSLSLLHTLRQYQFYAKSKGVTFDLGAVTVDPQTSSYDPSPLKPYLASLGVPYFYEEQCILETASSLPDVASICSFCSRMKRGRIYAAARREGYNVLALGQHLDDLAESFLMSIFHNGILRTMKACYTVQEGDLRVIRPFIYVREKDLRNFAENKKLPVIPENCPACFEAPKERHRMKQLLAAQEVLHPRLFPSLQAAIHPILSISRTGVSARHILATAREQGGGGQGEEEEEDF